MTSGHNESTRRALVVVDVQKDFCEGGSLAVAGGTDVARAISEHLAGRRSSYAVVVATRDAHIDPGAHFATPPQAPDFRNSWPPHCVQGTPGIDFSPELDTEALDAVFDKGAHAAAYSGFEGATPDGKKLADWLRGRGVRAVDVVGIATDYCVRASALDAVRAGFDTRVLLDLTAGVAPESTQAALAELAQGGIELTGRPVVRSG